MHVYYTPMNASHLLTYLQNYSVADQAAATAASMSQQNNDAADAGLLVPAEEGAGPPTAGGERADVKGEPQVRRRPLLCRPIAVMLLTAGVFVAMALANSPLLIRRWVRAQPTLRCLVPYRMSRLCAMLSLSLIHI